MLLHVFAVNPGSAQVLLADVAEVGLGVGVGVDVVRELQGSAEALVAERTVVPNARVGQQVGFQHALLFEGLLTNGALERPGVGVQPLVAPHGAGEGEAFPTDGAVVWFLAGVGPLVLRQVDVLCEALPAGRALKRALA